MPSRTGPGSRTPTPEPRVLLAADDRAREVGLTGTGIGALVATIPMAALMVVMLRD